MKASIIHMEPTPVLFVRRTGSYKESAPQAWSQLMGFAYGNKVITKETSCFGISHSDPKVTDSDRIQYDACISDHPEAKPQGEIGRQTIRGGCYARFLHKGPHEELHKTYDAIFAGWLPQSGRELANAPCFERYLNRDPRRTKPENLKTEIYIPLSQ